MATPKQPRKLDASRNSEQFMNLEALAYHTAETFARECPGFDHHLMGVAPNMLVNKTVLMLQAIDAIVEREPSIKRWRRHDAGRRWDTRL